MRRQQGLDAKKAAGLPSDDLHLKPTSEAPEMSNGNTYFLNNSQYAVENYTAVTTAELQAQACELSTISDDQPAREFTWAELASERAWLRSLVDMFGGKDLGVCVLSAPGEGLTLQVSSDARGLRKLMDAAADWQGPMVPAVGEIWLSEECARGKTWPIYGIAHLAHIAAELAERRAAA